MDTVRLSNRLAVASLISLMFLGLVWELWWAPLRPGGSWLALKALPLLLPLPGLLHGRRYTHQWTPLLALAYFVEGVVRAVSERGVPAALAAVEIVLALMLFAGAVLFVRASAKVSRHSTAK